MKSQFPKQVVPPSNVTRDSQTTNSTPPKRPNKTTAAEYQAQQMVKDRSAAAKIRAQASIVSSSTNRRISLSQQHGNAGPSSIDGLSQGISQIQLEEEEHEVESVGSHSTTSGIDEEDLKCLVDNTVKRMKDQLQTINAGSDPEESIKELAEILIDAHPAAQPQVVESFVNALAPKTSEQTGEQTESVLTENQLTDLITLIEQALVPNSPTLDNDSDNDSDLQKSIAGIAQGILDGIATTPDLDNKTSAQLVEAVSNWCTDPAKVPDEDVLAMLQGADTIRKMKMQSAEFGDSDDESIQKFIQSVSCIGNVCYVRRVDAALDNLPDDKLPAITQKLQNCAKWFVNQDSPAHKLHETFTKLIDRIDERQSSIGKIPEIDYEVESVDSHSTASEIDEEDLKRLVDDTIKRMKDQLQTINAGSDPKESIKELAEILVGLHPAAQPQVVESFVNALAPKTSEQTESVLAENELTYLITLLDNDSEKSIAGIAQGILDGIATTPDLDNKTSAQLVEAVSNWCTDPAKVPDEGVYAVHQSAGTILKMLSPEFGDSDDKNIQKFIQSLNCIGNVCYVRTIDAALDDIPDDKLPAITQKLRHCAKWFFNQDSPGHKLHETFTKLIDRIDERQPSIGKIPEIGHVVWVGKPISEESIENLLNFLRLSNDYETTIIATDRPQETQRVINQVIDRLSEQSPGFENLRTKVKPCHYEEWLPADNEMIGDVSGAEIRALVETLRSGYGNVYPAASDILRLLGLRSEKTVNGETKKGGLYFDADLQWHQPMPSLSSPLGITLNVKPGDINESGDINNNVLGVPSDTEVIDKFIQYIVHGYRDPDIGTAMKEVEKSYPNLAARIKEMNEEYAKTNAENKQLHPTEHDPKFEFNKELTKGEKQKIREENRTRAQEILAQVHPAQNKVDYSRFRHAMAVENNEIVNSRFALTLALSGPAGLRTFLENMFSADYDMHERFSQLGRIGRMHTDGALTDEVYTETSDAPWAKASNFENNDPSNPRRSRRATIGGATTLGELEKAPTGLFSDQYAKQYKNQSGKSDSNS